MEAVNMTTMMFEESADFRLGDPAPDIIVQPPKSPRLPSPESSPSSTSSLSSAPSSMSSAPSSMSSIKSSSPNLATLPPKSGSPRHRSPRSREVSPSVSPRPPKTARSRGPSPARSRGQSPTRPETPRQSPRTAKLPVSPWAHSTGPNEESGRLGPSTPQRPPKTPSDSPLQMRAPSPRPTELPLSPSSAPSLLRPPTPSTPLRPPKTPKSSQAISPPSPSGSQYSSYSVTPHTTPSKKPSFWFSSLTRRKEGRSAKKKSLTSIFDATERTRNDSSSSWNSGPPIPRANSASAGDRNSCDLLSTDISRLNLTRLALASNGDDGSAEILDDSFEGNQRRNSPHPQTYYTIDSRRLASKHQKNNLLDKKLLTGVKQFNLDPKKGLELLIQAGFVEDTPEGVARFLFRQERLSKKQIGKYLGSHDKFNQQVLRRFVQCHEFSHLLLVTALRQFLWSFRLPGEAMQIDRVMESFAEHYCAQNPNLFEERDTCYILSFSIIMLNTALHNKNVKQKITLEQFISQNRGINSGKDLPGDILELIYRNIKEEPFKIPDETYDDLMYTFFSPELEGWLLKRGGSWKNWKRRWFVLSDRCLYYFQHTAENVPKGIIPLENIKVRPLDDKDGKLYCFELYSDTNNLVKGCKTDSKGTVVQGNHKTYRMSANSEDDRSLWIQSIRDSIKEHSFYDIIAAKKAALRRKHVRSVYGTMRDERTGGSAPVVITAAKETPA